MKTKLQLATFLLKLFSGCSGHVRVMTTKQLRILLEQAGFTIESFRGLFFNYFIIFNCTKPL